MKKIIQLNASMINFVITIREPTTDFTINKTATSLPFQTTLSPLGFLSYTKMFDLAAACLILKLKSLYFCGVNRQTKYYIYASSLKEAAVNSTIL